MRRIFYIIVIFTAVLIAGCGGGINKGENPAEFFEDSVEIADTGVVYGLACEGCTDSVVWLLPPDASDPIPYDVVDAMKKHKILGRIKTGDAIAIVVNEKDSAVADIVIDIDQLKGTWCYRVLPELKHAENLSRREQREFLAMIPDSIKDEYYRPVEYGIMLKRNNAASPVARLSGELIVSDESPFVYPTEAMYTAWHIIDGRLVLTKQVSQHIVIERDSLDDETDEETTVRIEAKTMRDTVDIAFLAEDSLALKFKTYTQGYYRKH